MDELVGDLLQLSTITRGDIFRTGADVSAVAERVVDALRASEPKRNVLAIIAPNLVARADPGLLRVVLENLIGNAWKFTSKRESAVIEVGRDPDEGPGAFFVRDNGAGFDDARASKLFEPFRRLHQQSEFKGTGIGLATVKRIIRRHGGRIRARGTVGEGASFHFTLPG
jgi:signal transduction histidine kinase